MRLSRALWGLLAIALVGALAVTWWLTRPLPPDLPWIGAVRVLAADAFSEPFGLAAGPDGTVYMSDAGSAHRIRRIAPDGAVTTVAGSERGFRDGRGAEARFATPSHIALAPDGSLVVADTGNHAIRRVALDGVVTTIAGDGIAGYVDGPARQSRFNGPIGVAVDGAGRIIVADTYNDRIRVIAPDGQVRTLAGGDDGSSDGRARPPGAARLRDGPGPDARFDTPCGVAVDASGRILVADTGNGLIRAIQPNGVVATVATTTVALARPIALAVGAGGDVYVADESGQIVVLPVEGDRRVLAGGGVAGFADGVGSEARFRRPSGITLVGPALRRVRRSLGGGGAGRSPAAPRLIVADAGNALVREIQPLSQGCVGAGPCGADDSSWPWTAIDLPTPPPPRRAPAFDAEAFARTPLLWPVGTLDGPHEIAGTFGEARGEAGQERFHAGIDVREPQGTLVRAVRDGIVSSPIATFAFDTLNEGVRIGDLAYIHIRVGRSRAGSVGRDRSPSGPAPSASSLDLQRFAPVYDAEGMMVRMRVKRGAHFATGDVVGSVNAFNHVHLNVGWSGEEHNPLRFRLVQFTDTVAPSIAAAGVRLFDESWAPLNPDRLGPMRGSGRRRRPTRLPPVEPVVVRGRVRIVVDAWDQADGNKAYRRLGLYAIGYSVTPTAGPALALRGEALAGAGTGSSAKASADETPNAGRRTLVFDRMRREADAARRVYATGSGIPVYGASRTQFLYVATTSYHDGMATEGFWDTTTLAPGTYLLRVFAEDFSGNRTTRDVRVVVVSE